MFMTFNHTCFCLFYICTFYSKTLTKHNLGYMFLQDVLVEQVNNYRDTIPFKPL